MIKLFDLHYRDLAIDKSKTIVIGYDYQNKKEKEKVSVCVILESSELKKTIERGYCDCPLYKFEGQTAIDMYWLLGGFYTFTSLYNGCVDWDCRKAWLASYDDETKKLALQIEKEIVAAQSPVVFSAKDAWKIYNFVNEYKAGHFGLITLDEAITKYFKNYNQKNK